MMRCKRGDVIRIRFPHSDLVTVKKRPALVVQADGLNTSLAQKVVALVTHVQRRGPTRVLFYRDSVAGIKMGIKEDSVVVADNLQTVLEREIHDIIGHCPDMTKVDDALRKTLGL